MRHGHELPGDQLRPVLLRLGAVGLAPLGRIDPLETNLMLHVALGQDNDGVPVHDPDNPSGERSRRCGPYLERQQTYDKYSHGKATLWADSHATFRPRCYDQARPSAKGLCPTLVVTRRPGEGIVIELATPVKGKQVRLAIDGPRRLPVVREELLAVEEE